MSFTKRIDQAREAFKQRDVQASMTAHTPQAILQATEEHGGASHQYIGDMVYGGLDGIVTTFAVVSGVAGAELGASIILIMGLANLLADGFSMASGAYLSSKSEREYYQHERNREMWEVEHFPEGEQAELIHIYQSDGYSQEDAEKLVEIQSRDTERMVDAMMVYELGLLPDDRRPILSALATFVSFLIAGSLPLLVYLLNLFAPVAPEISFPISLAFSGLALFVLGAAKVLVTARNWFRSGVEMLAVGSLAAGVAYVVGFLLRGLGA